MDLLKQFWLDGFRRVVYEGVADVYDRGGACRAVQLIKEAGLDHGEELVVVKGAVLDLGEAVGQEDPIFEGDLGLVAEYHVSELCPGFTIGR